MDFLLWVIAVVALIFIGIIAVIKWTLKKGHKGYTKGRDAIRNRRNKNA
jgi:hypothetical protein